MAATLGKTQRWRCFEDRRGGAADCPKDQRETRPRGSIVGGDGKPLSEGGDADGAGKTRGRGGRSIPDFWDLGFRCKVLDLGIWVKKRIDNNERSGSGGVGTVADG